MHIGTCQPEQGHRPRISYGFLASSVLRDSASRLEVDQIPRLTVDDMRYNSLATMPSISPTQQSLASDTPHFGHSTIYARWFYTAATPKKLYRSTAVILKRHPSCVVSCGFSSWDTAKLPKTAMMKLPNLYRKSRPEFPRVLVLRNPRILTSSIIATL